MSLKGGPERKRMVVDKWLLIKKRDADSKPDWNIED